ncbi:hypothetical protein ASF60_22200 [Methylobacterium sp. Leaf113]|nr:hypothetical protein ASF60_22200 [Methylobacterium sp. Leaf113]
MVKSMGTALLTGTMSKFREMAGRLLMADGNVRLAVYRQNLMARGAVAARMVPRRRRGRWARLARCSG